MNLIAYLVAGIILGPSLLNLTMPDWLSILAQLAGGLFLLFAGWELRFLDVRTERRFFAVTFLGTFFVPFLAGLIFSQNLFIAAAFGISALPVAIQILKEKDRYDSDLSRKAITLASLCDIAAWLTMFFTFPATSIAEWIRSHWFIMMFFAGLGLSRFRQVSPAVLLSQKWILAPIFFITLGWKIPLVELFDLRTSIVILAVAIVAKVLGTYGFSRLAKKAHTESMELSFVLNARGAMEIVAANTAYAVGVIEGKTFAGLVVLAVVTSIMAVPFIRHRSKIQKVA